MTPLELYKAGEAPQIPYITPGVWQHFKGGLYVVHGVIRDSSNEGGKGWMVHYTSLTYGQSYVRGYQEFMSTAESGADRFRYIGPVHQHPHKTPEKEAEEG